jgi:hypothetical protein
MSTDIFLSTKSIAFSEEDERALFTDVGSLSIAFSHTDQTPPLVKPNAYRINLGS